MFNSALFNEVLFNGIISAGEPPPPVTYHVILDASFTSETPDANRVLVIGRDATGSPVYGAALDSAELALVGERLDFHFDPSVPSAALAADVASAIIARQRLEKIQGKIIIPPAPAVELWDVVRITDTPTAQASANYRVSGIRFLYRLAGPEPRLTHTLYLSAP